MLWYKSWLETRSRFLISLLGMLALCSFLVDYGNRDAMPSSAPAYYYNVLQSAHVLLSIMWVLAVTLLAMGGLLREKAVGTVSFTLALPVSRLRLMRVRILVVLVEAMMLVIVPWAAMFLIGLAGKTHSIYQASFHMALLAGGGMLFLGMALLISSLVEGEYTAPVVTFGVMLGISVVLSSGSLHEFSPMEFIMGAQFLDRRTRMLIGPIPWLRIAVSVVIGAVLVAISTKSVRSRDF